MGRRDLLVKSNMWVFISQQPMANSLMRKHSIILVSLLAVVLCRVEFLRADDQPAADEQARLDILQQALKNDYDRLEKKLLELAEKAAN